MSDLTGSLVVGDCLEAMRALPEGSVDSVVTDPPYLIGFLGREWDESESPKQAEEWHRTWTAEAFRLLKPGGHLLSFGGTRTFHRLAAGAEDAGFEIRDTLVWAYAEGFPKGQDLGRMIDKRLGRERTVVGERTVTNVPNDPTKTGYDVAGTGRLHTGTKAVTEPASPEAAKWDGWSTTLKPAWEPIVLARKPMQGGVVDNVLRHGTGAMNIDATRIPVGDDDPSTGGTRRSKQAWLNHRNEPRDPLLNEKGRWPANVVLTDPVFDGQYPAEVVGGGETSQATATWKAPTQGEFLQGIGGAEFGPSYSDVGTYSRFFLIPKARHTERQGSKHPTMKPVRLLIHLIRLVTPPGGLVLDPFGGSGSTGVAAKLGGYKWIVIERDPEAAEDARVRLSQTFGALLRELV